MGCCLHHETNGDDGEPCLSGAGSETIIEDARREERGKASAKKPRKIEECSREWYRRRLELLLGRVPDIYSCAHCGSPVVRGYCCMWCGSNDPYPRKE